MADLAPVRRSVGYAQTVVEQDRQARLLAEEVERVGKMPAFEDHALPWGEAHWLEAWGHDLHTRSVAADKRRASCDHIHPGAYEYLAAGYNPPVVAVVQVEGPSLVGRWDCDAFLTNFAQH